MILNVDYRLKLSNYTSLKPFLCLKWILNKFFTILNSQFNYHTLPVTPFNHILAASQEGLISVTNNQISFSFTGLLIGLHLDLDMNHFWEITVQWTIALLQITGEVIKCVHWNFSLYNFLTLNRLGGLNLCIAWGGAFGAPPPRKRP